MKLQNVTSVNIFKIYSFEISALHWWKYTVVCLICIIVILKSLQASWGELYFHLYFSWTACQSYWFSLLHKFSLSSHNSTSYFALTSGILPFSLPGLVTWCFLEQKRLTIYLFFSKINFNTLLDKGKEMTLKLTYFASIWYSEIP